MNTFDANITIEIIKGGFVLHYPVKENEPAGAEYWTQVREVFTSPRKLQAKVREVLSSLSLVAEDEKDKSE